MCIRDRNYSLAYDETTGTTYVGAYQNALVAYDKDNNELWRFETNGPVHEMKVDAAQGLLVVGCEDQNVYLLGLQDGSLKNTINVQRRIYGVDISSDGSKIAVASATTVSYTHLDVYKRQVEGFVLYAGAQETELALAGGVFCKDKT